MLNQALYVDQSVRFLGCIIDIEIFLLVVDELLLLLLLLLPRELLHLWLIMLLLMRSTDPLSGSPDNRICHCLLHQVDFTLPNEFHVGIGEWNE